MPLFLEKNMFLSYTFYYADWVWALGNKRWIKVGDAQIIKLKSLKEYAY